VRLHPSVAATAEGRALLGRALLRAAEAGLTARLDYVTLGRLLSRVLPEGLVYRLLPLRVTGRLLYVELSFLRRA
jgi:hypothetical protein